MMTVIKYQKIIYIFYNVCSKPDPSLPLGPNRKFKKNSTKYKSFALRKEADFGDCDLHVPSVALQRRDDGRARFRTAVV